jgi:hypothetical protein
MTKVETIAWLKDFIGKDKYTSYPEWGGDIKECSTEETIYLVNRITDDCAQALLDVYVHSKRLSKSKITEIIQSKADSDEAHNMDTEDREFLGEMFGLIAEACNIPKEQASKNNLNWIEFVNEINQARDQAEKVHYACAECGKTLILFIWNADQTAGSKWLITRCASCKDIDYKELKSGIGQHSMQGAGIIEEYDADEYSRGVIINLVEILRTENS